MKNKIPSVGLLALSVIGSGYLAIASLNIDTSQLLAEVVHISATVPPSIVVVEDDSSNNSSQGVLIPSGSSRSSVTTNTEDNNESDSKAIEVEDAKEDAPEETNNIQAVDTSNVTETKKVTPTNNTPKKVTKNTGGGGGGIIIQPVKETKNVVIEVEKEYKEDVENSYYPQSKMLTPSRISTPYVEPFFPKIVRKEYTGKKVTDTVINTIFSLNLEKSLKGHALELYRKKIMILKGKAKKPYSKVLINIEGQPLQGITYADKNAEWFWSPDKPLEKGNHMFSAIFLLQGTDEVIGETNIPLSIVDEPVNVSQKPLDMLITPSYTKVSKRNFALSVNFFVHDEAIEFPLILEYEIFDIEGNIYGRGKAQADPAGGSVVRLPFELHAGTPAGIYRVHIKSNVLGKDIYADAVFNVVEGVEAKLVDKAKSESWINQNRFIFNILFVLFVIALILYIWKHMHRNGKKETKTKKG